MNEQATAGTEEIRDLYRELILDHARSPRNFGSLSTATHEAEGINPLCGDKLKLYLQVDDAGGIRNVSFNGTGCAISVASASLLTEAVVGMQADRALDFFAAVVASLTGREDRPGIELGKLTALQGVCDYPSRVKCATLAWHALDAAIRGERAPATTES